MVLGQCERGNVLVGGGMKAAHDPCKLDNRSNVRAVIATTSQSCVAELPDQVRGRARSESCHHRLAMSVVQHQLIGMLRRACSPLSKEFIDALRVQLDPRPSGHAHWT